MANTMNANATNETLIIRMSNRTSLFLSFGTIPSIVGVDVLTLMRAMFVSSGFLLHVLIIYKW